MGEQLHEFAVRCHECRALNKVTLDAGGDPLLVAEGLIEWAHPPEPLPLPAVQGTHKAMPAKKRHKAATMLSSVAADDDAELEALEASASAVPVTARHADMDADDDDDDDDDEDKPLRKAKANGKTSKGSAKRSGARPLSVKTGAPKAKGSGASSAAAHINPSPPTQRAPKEANGAKLAKGKGGPVGKVGPVATSAKPAADGKARLAVIKLGSVVLALFHDGQYYTGVVEDMQEGTGIKAKPARGAKSSKARAGEPKDTSKDQIKVAWDDGDPSSWVECEHVALAYRQPLPAELAPGMPVLALFSGVCTTADDDEQTDVWFPARVLRAPSAPKGASADDPSASNFELEWLGDEGDEGDKYFSAGVHQLRTFLAHIPMRFRRVAPPKPLRSISPGKQWGRGFRPDGTVGSLIEDEEGAAEGVAADLLRRSSRDLSKADPSDTKLLKDALAELQRAWAGNEPRGGWRVEVDYGGIPGLLLCHDFLDAKEVEALRTLMGAHRQWAYYHYVPYTSTALGSAVQRIDFGPNAGEAGRGEGVVSGASMWRLGALRAELLNMVGERLRHVFQRQGLWAHTQPDTLQLTKIGEGQQIANHYDRRDRWQEGIASIAWSELPTSERESRGEAWTLVMEKGFAKRDRTQVSLSMPPGAAYVLTGRAQGVTKACEKLTVGHNPCHCCWTHGVRLGTDASVPRQSMTLRVLADEDEEVDGDDEEDKEEENEDGGQADDPDEDGEGADEEMCVEVSATVAAEG